MAYRHCCDASLAGARQHNSGECIIAKVAIGEAIINIEA